MTRTARYIVSRLPRQGFGGTVRVPAGALADPGFIPRLAIKASPTKNPYDIQDVASVIEGEDINIVCDTSIFDDQKPASFWRALTDIPGKLVVTPRVEDELRDWLARLSKPRPQVSYADEEVVYVAFALALKTGKETAILTKDEDLLDQFYRLVYLLDSHYRSMLIARLYVSDFGRFRTHPLPTSGIYGEYFKGGNGVLVERSETLPFDVLPAKYQFVPVQCIVLGDNLNSWMAFGAEREMFEVLLTKGAYDGANSSLLLPRNCHLALPGLDILDGLNVFVVAEDQNGTLSSGQKIPMIEWNQALSYEGFKLYELATSSICEASGGAPGWSCCQDRRR